MNYKENQKFYGPRMKYPLRGDRESAKKISEARVSELQEEYKSNSPAENIFTIYELWRNRRDDEMRELVRSIRGEPKTSEHISNSNMSFALFIASKDGVDIDQLRPFLDLVYEEQEKVELSMGVEEHLPPLLKPSISRRVDHTVESARRLRRQTKDIVLPRMEFTFWPYDGDSDVIKNMSPEQIHNQIIDMNPGLLPQILHELWRTGRDGDIREVLENSYSTPGAINTLSGTDMVTTIVTAASYGEEIEDFRSFLEIVYTEQEKMECGIEKGEKLPALLKPGIKRKVEYNMGYAEYSMLILGIKRQ